MSLELILLVVAILIIIPLAVYAFYISAKARRHKAELEEKSRLAILQGEQEWRSQQLELVKDIKFLANSVLQEQCEVTEGAMRLQFAIDRLDPELWNSSRLTALREFYALVKDMPILEAYKQLTKKERMSLDKKRWDLENEHKDQVNESLKWLSENNFSSVTQVH